MCAASTIFLELPFHAPKAADALTGILEPEQRIIDDDRPGVGLLCHVVPLRVESQTK